MPFHTNIFSPDTYHAAILAALHQSAANQDTRYLNMLAMMNGMGERSIPDLQAGIVHHLPDVPHGYNNSHDGRIVETLLPPPTYHPPPRPIVETLLPPPDQPVVRPQPQSSDDVIDRGGDIGGDGGPDSSVTTAAPDGPTTTVADLSSETPATISPDETTATPATQVATLAPPATPSPFHNPGRDEDTAPPAPPTNPLNDENFGQPDPDSALNALQNDQVAAALQDAINASQQQAAPTPTNPETSIVQDFSQNVTPDLSVDVNGNQVAAPSSTLNSPGYQVAGLPSEMSTNPGDLGLNGFNQGVLDSTSTNQGAKGDSLNANAMAANPTTTVTVAPPDFTAPGFLSPGRSQQEAEQQNDDDTAAPSPGLLASVFDAVTGNPAANNPGNAMAAMNAANQAQSEQAAANVAAMNSPGLIAANLSSMNDVSTALSNPSSFNVDPGFSTGFNVAGPVTGSLYGSGFMGDQGVLAGDLSSATNMNSNVAALMDAVNTDFNAPGFEQDASNNAAQTAISTALDNAATNSISQEADTSSPSAAPTGYSPGDMGFSGLNADTGMGTGIGVVAGPGFGGDVAASPGFSGINAGGFASDVTGGFNADAASAAAAAAAASDTGGFGGLTGGFGGFGGTSAGFGGVDADAGVGISADAGVGLGADAGGDSGGDAGGDGGAGDGGGDGGGGW